MQASGHCHSPAALPLGKEALLPTGQEDGWTPEPVWTFPLPEFEPQIVQPLACSLYRRYSCSIPCRYFHIKWLHPTLILSQILRIENCMMVIECATRTGLFPSWFILLHPFQHAYILLTLCQRTALSFTTLLPTDLALPTEIMNAFLFCET